MKRIDAIEVLARHAIVTLPDSMSGQKHLLNAVRLALPLDNATRLDAQALLQSIKQHDDLQAELALSYRQAKHPETKN